MSNFDLQLNEELEKLKKKKKQNTPQLNTFDSQLNEELEHLKKYGTNTGKDTGKYKDRQDDIAPVRTVGKLSGQETAKTPIDKKLESLLSVYGNEDFKKKSGYVSTKAEGFWDKLSSKYGMGYNDLQYEYINNLNGIRDEIDSKAASWGRDTGKTTSSYAEKALDYMTAEEVAVYNYYYQTEGKDKAEEFLDALAETLSARKAGKTFENMQGKTAAEILYGIPAGAEQFRQGVKNLGNMIVGKDDYIPQTSTQILTGMIREDLADDGFEVLGSSAGQMAFDALTTGTNMIPSIAVGAVNPVAGAAVMGASAAGNAYQEDLNEFGDKEAARKYATTIGILEGMLSYALGGIGKLGGTSATISRAVSGIKNGALRFALEYGGKIASEGFEEGLQEVLNPIVKNIVHGTDEEVNWEEAAYSALLGGLMGGVFGAGEVSSSHLSNSEAAVVEKVFNDRVAEKEANGKKLTNREKNEIYDSVVKDLEKGYISTDTIEEVLGDKSDYDALSKEAEEYDKLYNTPSGQLSKAQQDRLTELDTKNKANPYKDALNVAKEQYSKSVFELVKGGRLSESYNERARRGQAFEADLTQYDAKQQAVIQKAIDSGILNNTNRTHEFVDMIAKISADKGVLFDFVNNAKLKESSFAVDGKTVNGYFDTKNGSIGVNIDSAKALNTIVGHEITHVLEGTDFYTELQNAVIEYAKAKGDYQGRFDSLSKLYEGIEGADVNAELTADLVGDYLFTDEDFINNLSTNHRNVFQKIYDEVKYLLKVATAGSKEARELEKVKKAFEDAYRADNKAQGGKKYSVSETTDGRFAAVVDNDILSNIDTSSWDNTKKAEAKKAASDALKQFSDGIVVDGITRKVNKVSRREYTRSNYTESLYNQSPEVFADKMRAADVADDVVIAATNWNRDGGLKHPRSDNFVDFDHGNTLIVSGDAKYNAEVVVGITNTGEAVFYDVVDMQPTTFDIKKSESPTTATTQNAIGDIQGDSFIDNVAQAGENVKYSLSDSDGRQLTKEQQEFFKDSVVRDENGNLKVMYHGTSKGGHTVFDSWGKSNYGLFGTGSYFTDSRSIAESYTNKGKGNNKQVYETYLNIKNPLDMDAQADPAQWAKTFDEVDFPETGTNEDFYRAVEEYYTDQYLPKWEVAEIIRDSIEFGMGYDGITHIGGGRVNADGERHRVYIAFEAEQIKSVANTQPTGDADIRYSLSEDITDTQNEKGLDSKSEVQFSLSNDTAYMDKAISMNNSSLHVDSNVMTDAKAIRERIAARMNDIKDRGLVGLPEDIEGNTYIANSSYDGTEENTTICPRSLASEAFVDAVSEYLGRPLSVEEQIYISQDLQGRSLTPECTYCYVATDRKAYRAFLGEYINQRDAVLQKVKDNPNADVSRNGEPYKEFLNGRKDTNPMYDRFKMWVNAYKNGTPMVEASHLANINRLMGDINSEFGAELKPQIVDAMKYAQSASWAKKRINYVAYNGHILKWKQDRINKLNSHYGLRMYSFSDFHPAFVLENMQMITDASVRGLKMLGYTKDTDFVEIFAPSGMNINVSTFGFETGGNVYENNIIGAEWEKAKALREQYPNVGITFVATNDHLVNWALDQDWIDVVIPYHLVRTGAEVAKAFNYTNYTSESADTKTADWVKGDKKFIAPTEHNNDKATYLAALEKNHLKPRFERFIGNPNYMKLVNECRQSASESKPVQPVFNEDAAMVALAKLEANGYYQPVGGSVDRMYEIAAEVAEDMQSQLAPAMSLSEIGETPRRYGDYNIYGKDISLETAEEIAPAEATTEATTVSETESVADATMVTSEVLAEKRRLLKIEQEELDWMRGATGDYSYEKMVAEATIKKLEAEITAIEQGNNAPVKAPTAVSPYDAMGAAPYGFDPITQLQYEYGNLPDGEHPVREDSMPKSITGKDRVSLTARTVKGAGATPDEFVDLLHKETLGGRFSYIPITNSDTVQKAYNEIVKKGWEAARGEWETKVRRGEVSAELTATGSLLLNHAAKAEDRNAWLSVLHDYQIMGTNAGQAVQAMRILKTLTPDDSLYMIERSVEQMVEDMKLGREIVIDENLKQNYLNAKTDGERDTARQAIAKDVARQIPSTAMDMWTALRYLNMLGNFRTQVRNIIGNLGMSVTSGARNAVATSIEWLANKASGGKFHRTKSIFINKGQLKAARNDFENVKTVALNGGKFNDPMAKSLQFQQEVQDARRIFKIAPPVEWYRRATNWAMDTGDLVFSKMAYGRALAGYLKANGIKETDFSKIDQQKLDEARAYAIEEAQETTFRDNNWFSSWVSKLGRGKNTPKGVKIVSEGVMPFRKTPANILLRAEEYSPLGFVNATVKSIQAAKGKATGADVVNSWAKALTGTGLFALGMWLNNSGMLSGGPDEDDDKEWFESQYGWQNYAIQIGDKNYTIDFLSPAAMPLLMGAQLNELRQNSGVELKDLEKALLSIADPMIEMSMLQGLNDTLDNIRYAESNMGQFLVNACVSYLTQGLTNSFLGQLERSFEGQRMSTYTDKDSDLPAWLQKALGKASAKTPVLDYNQIPYVDAWGETEDIAPLPGFAENALSPSYISQGITDAVYEELNRLNDAQSDINVYPQTPDKTVTFDDIYGRRHEDYNLSAEEYVELAQLQGKTQKKLVEDILSNYRYSGLTDKEKARAVQLAYQYAKEYSRQEVLGADGFSADWMKRADAKGDIVNAIIAHTNDEKTFAYENPEKYQFFTENGISWDDYDSADTKRKQEYSDMYSWVSDEDHPGRYSLAKAVSDDFQTFWQYKSDCNNFNAKDENGETVSGLKKERVIDYINGLDIDYGAKIILFRSMYDGKKDKEEYDQDIIDYLNSREDISNEDMEAILKELG